MSDINWQMGKPPRNGNYLVETKDDFAIDYWFEHAWDDNGSNVIAWLPIEGDRVEVVRCKDCRYNYANMIPGGKGCQQNVYIETADNWYCADGEREGEQTEYHIENDGTYRGGENEKDSNSI